MTQKITFYGIFIWSLAILFFLYEFFIRVMPATISSSIIHDLNISAEEFALIGSFYYITYSIMQTPVGIIYDRYSVRLFLTIACAVCTLGVFGFAFGNNYFSILISRLLMGFGSSFGFISLLILALNWFPQKYFAFLGGLGQTLGALGPILAGAPVAFLMNILKGDWQLIFFGVGIYGSVLTCLIAVFIRTRPELNKDEVIYIKKPSLLVSQLKKVLKIQQVWMTMIYAGSIYVSLPLLGAYWGTLYLQTRGFDKTSAALMISMIWLGLAIASPVVGKLSNYFNRRKPFLVGVAIFGAIVSFGLLYLPLQNRFLLSILLISLGMAGSGQSLSFAVISDNVPEDLKGTAIGLNNTMVMFFATFLPPLATWVIQYEMEGQKTYLESDFQVGFLVMPIIFILAFLVSLFGIRETFCRQQDTIHFL